MIFFGGLLLVFGWPAYFFPLIAIGRGLRGRRVKRLAPASPQSKRSAAVSRRSVHRQRSGTRRAPGRTTSTGAASRTRRTHLRATKARPLVRPGSTATAPSAGGQPEQRPGLQRRARLHRERLRPAGKPARGGDSVQHRGEVIDKGRRRRVRHPGRGDARDFQERRHAARAGR